MIINPISNTPFDCIYNRHGILMLKTKATVQKTDGSVAYEVMYPYGLDTEDNPNVIPCYISYGSSEAMPMSGIHPKSSTLVTVFLPTLKQMGADPANWKYLYNRIGLVLEAFAIGTDPKNATECQVYDMSGIIVPYENHYEVKMRAR